jgi:hypothetical protein
MAYRDLVIVEYHGDHQRGAHPGVVRLALRRLIDGAIDPGHFTDKRYLRP